MNDNRVSEIKKEDKKAFKGFFIVIIVSGIIGAISNRILTNLRDVIGINLSNFLMSTLEQVVPYASIVLSVVVTIISTIIYSKSRKGYELWKNTNDDDDSIDKIEQKLSYILLVVSINLILGFFFLGAGIKLLVFENINEGFDSVKVYSLFIGLILCVASSILIQKKVINLEKEINPLLKGSIYDAKFAKKWIDSCDESIKLEIYKSSYSAYKAVSMTCLILWVVCIIGFDLWDFGIMPLVMVTIIWLVLTISYCMESIKNSKSK